MELYKRQTMLVEDLLRQHPEYDPAHDERFTEAERRAFRAVFQPIWGSKTYVEVFRCLRRSSEGFARAQQVFRRWLVIHQVRHHNLLWPEEHPSR